MCYNGKKKKHFDFSQFQKAIEHCNSMPHITIGLQNPLLQLTHATFQSYGYI